MLPQRLGYKTAHSTQISGEAAIWSPLRSKRISLFGLANSLVPETLRQDCAGVNEKLFLAGRYVMATRTDLAFILVLRFLFLFDFTNRIRYRQTSA
jgi:hypothetical protein